MRIYGTLAASAALCLICWGCGGSPSGRTPSGSTTGATTEAGAVVSSAGAESPNGEPNRTVPADVPSIEATEDDPTGLTGRWLVSMGLMWPEISQLLLVEISGGEGAYEARVVESAVRTQIQIREIRKVEDRVSFQLAIEDQNWAFDGRLVAGRIQGAVELHDQVSLTWLERTKQRTLSSAQASDPPPSMDEFTAVQRHEDPKELVKGMLQFVERNPASPFVFDALRTVVKLAKAAERSENELRGAIGKLEELSLPWGVRWQQNTVENIAYDLATADGPPDAAIDALALEYAESARAELPESANRARRQSVELAYAVALVNNGRAEEGKGLLDELIANSPNEGELRYRSALAAETLGDFDGAVESLLVLWPHPLATRELERIWKGKYGDLSGLELQFDEAYLRKFPPLTTTPYAGREDPASNQVALVELFTGTGCPPCVAADVAFESLGRTFNVSDVILLQYHLHVPSPDPLTNPDSEKRANYYKASGTPFILFSGKESVRGGGPRQKAPSLFQEYRDAVEMQLKQTTPVKIELDAKNDDGKIAIDVKLSGVEPSEALRLRIALIEATVRYTGLNGVRLHHSVVRAMPNGASGVEVPESEWAVHCTVDVNQLRESLQGYLADFQKELSQDIGSAFQFPAEPLDLNRLGVTAFLQNDETQEVIQAAFVPMQPE